MGDEGQDPSPRRVPPPLAKELDCAHAVSHRQKPPDDRRDDHVAESTPHAIASSKQIQARGRQPGAGCTTRSCRMHEHPGTRRQSPRSGSAGALLDAPSGLFAGGLLAPPARNEREPGRGRPGTDDDLRNGSSAAVPAARPRRGCSRSPHRVPVVDQVQDDEADERADVDEHGPTAKQRLGRGRRGPESPPLATDRRTRPGELHERALQDATSSRELTFILERGAPGECARNARCAHAVDPPPGSP